MQMKFIASIALFLAATNCLAVDEGTARLNAENATKEARQGNYAAAFTEIGWLLNDNSPAIRKYAEDVLKANSAIANGQLLALTVSKLSEMSCDYGLANAKQTADQLLASVGRYADEDVTADAQARVTEAFDSADVLDQAAKCQRAKDVQQAEATKSALTRLRGLDIFAFCEQYGSVLRGKVPDDYVNIKSLVQIFTAEAKRRGAAVIKDLVLKERIRIGINQCTLYASWGYPHDVNRTVGAWGTHSQLVYGQYGPYVYLENGVVRSFQD